MRRPAPAQISLSANLKVLEDGVGGSLIPVFVYPLHGRKHFDVLAQFRGEYVPAVPDVTDQFQRATDQFTQVFGVAGPQAEEMALRASRNIEAVSQASTVLTKGAKELSREWFDLIRDQFAKHLDAMNRVAGCRSLQDLVSVQSEIVRDRLGEAVNSSRRIAEVSFRITDEAARIIQFQANQNVAGIRAAS